MEINLKKKGITNKFAHKLFFVMHKVHQFCILDKHL